MLYNYSPGLLELAPLLCIHYASFYSLLPQNMLWKLYCLLPFLLPISTESTLYTGSSLRLVVVYFLESALRVLTIAQCGCFLQCFSFFFFGSGSIKHSASPCWRSFPKSYISIISELTLVKVLSGFSHWNLRTKIKINIKIVGSRHGLELRCSSTGLVSTEPWVWTPVKVMLERASSHKCS